MTKIVNTYNNGFLLETYNTVKDISKSGNALLINCEDKKVKIEQGIDWLLSQEIIDEKDQPEDEETKKLTLVYGEDVIFYEIPISNYKRSESGGEISFYEKEIGSFVRVIFLTERAKTDVNITLIEEK